MNLLKDLLFKDNYTLGYRLQVLSLMLIALTLPFSIALNNMAIGLLVVSWLFLGNYITRIKEAFSNKLFLLFVGVFLMQAVGLLYTSNMGEGLGKIERKAALFVLPFILASSPQLKVRHVHAVVLAFVLSCAAMASYASFVLLNTYGEIPEGLGLTEYIDAVTGLHHAYSGLYLLFAVAACLYLAFTKGSAFGEKYKVPLVTVASLLYFFLIILAARTAVFTSFLLFLVGLVYYLLKKKRGKHLIAGLLVCLAIVAVVLALPNTKNKIADFDRLRGVHSPLTPRLIKWGCCFRVLDEQNGWVLGVGTGDVQDHLQQCYTDEKFWGDRYILNAHNEYLEEFVRHGAVGAVLFICSLGIPFVLAVRLRKTLYILFLVIFMSSSVTESTLSRQKGVVFYALFNAVFAFSYLIHEKRVAIEEESIPA